MSGPWWPPWCLAVGVAGPLRPAPLQRWARSYAYGGASMINDDFRSINLELFQRSESRSFKTTCDVLSLDERCVNLQP